MHDDVIRSQRKSRAASSASPRTKCATKSTAAGTSLCLPATERAACRRACFRRRSRLPSSSRGIRHWA